MAQSRLQQKTVKCIYIDNAATVSKNVFRLKCHRNMQQANGTQKLDDDNMNNKNKHNISKSNTAPELSEYKGRKRRSTAASLENRTGAMSKIDESIMDVNLSGLHEFSNATTTYGKMLWAILIALAIVGSCYEVYKILYNYYNCPIVTEWSVKATRAIDFPKVEICLTSSIGQSAIDEYPNAAAVAATMKKRLLFTDSNRPNKPTKERSKRQVHQHVPPQFWDIAPEWHPSKQKRDTTTATTSDSNKNNNNTDLSNMTKLFDDFMRYSFSVDDVFLDCVFRDTMMRQLNCNDVITEVLNPNWGKCFVVSVGDRKQHVPGQGLVLVMNAQNDNYPTEKSLMPKTAGVIVSIHHDYNPYSFNYINVPTKSYTRMSLYAEYHEYLDVETGPKAQPCISEEEKHFSVLDLEYNVAACQMDCFQNLTLTKCDCIILQDVSFVKADIRDSVHFCSPEEITNCVLPEVTNSNETQTLYESCCDKCHTSCSIWHYNVQSSSMGLHEPAFNFLQKYNISLDNLVYLHIAHTSLEYTEVGQEWATEIDNLIADFGGQVGLWIGGNLITFIQIPIMLLLIFFVSMYEKFAGVRKIRRVVDQKRNMWSTWSTIIQAGRDGQGSPLP
ncbi:Acid-sensing ion channel 1 [Trichinella patagoniensis]|uniref:Acid-sensing ion channel 1 n=1 Tax=Trichinella patagoniensis TaxID=990121 RepID=A0A0V1ABQ1_9BILA|nr:Acid-sensing ion channel 1 [Trichinella patagoniensis]